MPWVAIPLFALLVCQSPSFGGATLRLIHLCIPLAALLVHRYGRRGLLASVIGMLIASYAVNVAWPWVDYSAEYENYFYRYFFERRPLWPFVPMAINTTAGAMVPDLAVFVLALAVAVWILQKSDAGSVAARWRERRRVGTLAIVLPIMLLPITFTLYREDLGGGFQAFSLWNMALLLDAYLLWLGLTGARSALVIGTLAAVCGFGLAIEVSGVADDLSRSFAIRSDEVSAGVLFDNVRWGQRAPLDFFLSAACFAVGRALRRVLPGELAARQPHGAGVLFGVLLLLWGGALVYELLPRGSALPPILWQLQLFGGEHVVPVTALYAGALYRLRGVGAAVAFALLLMVLKLTLLHLQWTNHLPVPLEQAFEALAFGALGVALRDLLSGSRTDWHARHWIAYLAMLMVMAPQWFEIEDPGQLVWPAATVTALMAGACAVTWFWQRRFGRASDSAPAGWLAFATLAGLLSSLGPQLVEAGSSLLAAGGASQLVAELMAQLNGHDELSDASMQLLVVPAYLAVLFMVAATFFGSLSKMSDEVHGIVRWVRELRTGPAPAPAAADPEPNPDPQTATRWSRFAARCASASRWAGRIALAIAACGLVLFIRHSTL